MITTIMPALLLTTLSNGQQPAVKRDERTDLSENPVQIEQVQLKKGVAPASLKKIRQKAGGPIDVSQLPEDIDLANDQGAPETAIARTDQTPELKLYRQVAEVWQTIRQKGQQPTPELIAREIGPDALATFLDQNPGAESIFGEDTDSLPVARPGDLNQSQGGFLVPISPASQ